MTEQTNVDESQNRSSQRAAEKAGHRQPAMGREMICFNAFGDCSQGCDCPVRVNIKPTSRRESMIDMILYLLIMLIAISAVAAIMVVENCALD